MPMSRLAVVCPLYGRWSPSDATVLTWMAIGKNVFLWNCYCTRVATWPLAQLCAWGISSHRPSGVASDLTLFLPTAVKHILSNEDKGTALEQLIDQFLMNFTKIIKIASWNSTGNPRFISLVTVILWFLLLYFKFALGLILKVYVHSFMAKSRIKKYCISSHFSDIQFRIYILYERVRTHLYLMLLTSVLYVCHFFTQEWSKFIFLCASMTHSLEA